MKKLLLPLLAISSLVPAQAAVIAFQLEGKGGIGLLASNENQAVNGAFGSGGEVGAGITYDDVTNVLTINVAWGIANGFTNLTGNATAGHIHGPTPASGVGSFTQNIGVLFGLDSGPTWNNSASAGGVFGRTITLTETQEGQLLAGRYYINVHTTTNAPGEIRGNLVVVPETSTSVLAAAALGLLTLRRRRV